MEDYYKLSFWLGKRYNSVALVQSEVKSCTSCSQGWLLMILWSRSGSSGEVWLHIIRLERFQYISSGCRFFIQPLDYLVKVCIYVCMMLRPSAQTLTSSNTWRSMLGQTHPRAQAQQSSNRDIVILDTTELKCNSSKNIKFTHT